MRMTVDYPSRCPFCRAVHEAATCVTGKAAPEDGDATLCIRCGNVAIFDEAEPFGLRMPTRRESRALLRDRNVQRLVAAFRVGQVLRAP